MAGPAAKRKAPSSLGEPAKRQRISLQETVIEHLDSDEDEDGDNYEYRSESGDFSENEQTADTPSTPFSPARKKFPSELKHLKCTWEGCTKSFNRPIRLERHLKTHTNEREFICRYEGCDKAYFEDKHLQQHIKGSHTHERKHKCNWEGCDKSFLTSTRLKRHQDVHRGHDRFRCTAYPPCNETFRKHQTLQRHIRSEHLNLAPYPCTYIDPVTQVPCNAGFDGAMGLKKHEDRVHGALQFFCLECTIPNSYLPDGSAANLGFTTNTLLQSHIRKEHANTTCMFCDLKLSTVQEMNKHIDSQHSGTTLEQRKNVHCIYAGCGKAFTKKSNLNIHIRTAHMGERFICGEFDTCSTFGLQDFRLEDGCEKDFVSKAILEDHIRTAHLGLKSVVNANRKKRADDFIANDDAEESEHGDYNDTDLNKNWEADYDPKPTKQKKRRGTRAKAANIRGLLGGEYEPDMASQPQPPQRRSRRANQNQQPNVPEYQHQNFEDYIGDGYDWSGQNSNELVMQMTYLAPPQDPQQQTIEDLPGADIDWELQRRALEGGAFWIGADDGIRDGDQNRDTWAEDEREMRRLIGAGESAYPEL